MKMILILTTLHYLLYPPLKGFSHSLDTYVYKPLPFAFQGDDSEIKGFVK